MKQVIVRKSTQGFKDGWFKDYPLEVAVIENGKDFMQPTLVRDKDMGKVFGNGLIAAFIAMNVSVGGGVDFEED